MNQSPIPNADSEVDGTIEYRSPHVLAVVTVILGLLSALALLRPNLWIVPLITVALGCASLWSLSTKPEKIGRKAALFGIMLALFFGTWAPTRYFSRERWLTNQGRVYADAWLNLVRNKELRAAHQLHLRKPQRLTSGMSIDEYYLNSANVQSDLDFFFDKEPVNTFIKMQTTESIEFDRNVGYDQLEDADIVVLRYLVKYRLEGREQVLPLRVTLQRELDRVEGEYIWFVFAVT